MVDEQEHDDMLNGNKLGLKIIWTICNYSLPITDNRAAKYLSFFYFNLGKSSNFNIY